MTRYYAYARRRDGQIGQLIVECGTTTVQRWTGVKYRTVTEAARDVERLNLEIATERKEA